MIGLINEVPYDLMTIERGNVNWFSFNRFVNMVNTFLVNFVKL